MYLQWSLFLVFWGLTNWAQYFGDLSWGSPRLQNPDLESFYVGWWVFFVSVSLCSIYVCIYFLFSVLKSLKVSISVGAVRRVWVTLESQSHGVRRRCPWPRGAWGILPVSFGGCWIPPSVLASLGWMLCLPQRNQFWSLEISPSTSQVFWFHFCQRL